MNVIREVHYGYWRKHSKKNEMKAVPHGVLETGLKIADNQFCAFNSNPL